MNGWTVLLFVHGLAAILLIGALTHQTLAICWPIRSAGPTNFLRAARAVRAARYTNAVVILYLATMALGSIVYPYYRVNVRTFLEDHHWNPSVGFFEIKENLVAIGFGMLPLYWWLWRSPEAEAQGRRPVTLLLALIVWWAFFVGHFINNIRGFGQ